MEGAGPEEAGAGVLGEEGGRDTGEEGGCVASDPIDPCHLKSTRCLWDTEKPQVKSKFYTHTHTHTHTNSLTMQDGNTVYPQVH